MRQALRSCLPLAALLLAAGLLAPVPASGAGSAVDRLNHLVVLYMENRSFDSLFGKFPRANGLANAGAARRQVQLDGTPYTSLPQAGDYTRDPPAYDPRFPTSLPVLPFDCGL